MSNLTEYNPNFWEGMDPSEFAIPYVSIGQPLTKKGGKHGEFNYNNGNMVKELKNCKLLRVLKTRVLFGKSFTDPSLCSSDDFYVPSPRVKDPVSASCLNCVAAQWGDDIPEKAALAKRLWGKNIDRKPMCAETYNLLMADENNNPFFIKFQKTHLKIAQEKLFSRLKFGFVGTNPYLVAFDMKTKEEGQGYFVPVFENFHLLEGDEAVRADAAYRAYAAGAHNALAKEHEAMDAEKSDDSEGLPF